MTWLPSIALRPSFDTADLSWSVLRNSQNALLPATASDANYGLLNDISLLMDHHFRGYLCILKGKHKTQCPTTHSVGMASEALLFSLLFDN